MNNSQVYNETDELIRSIVRQEIKNFMKQNGFFRSVSGVVTGTSNGKYDVDVVDTKLSQILNESNSEIKVGDTVTIFDKFGSNYSNCYIAAKNGG